MKQNIKIKDKWITIRVPRALVVVGEVKKSFETKDNACRQVPKKAQVPWERQFFLQRSVGG